MEELEEKYKKEEKEKKLKKKVGRVREENESWATLKKIQTSVKKINSVARMIRGLSYKNAVIQLKLSPR